MAYQLFHGGCHDCMRQEESGLGICCGCRYFDARWHLPDLNYEAQEARRKEKNNASYKSMMARASREREEREARELAIKRAIIAGKVTDAESLKAFSKAYARGEA
jgi:hypothetical protein